MKIEAMIRKLRDAGYKVVKRDQGKGRPAQPRQCPRCGKWFETATEMRRAHDCEQGRKV